MEILPARSDGREDLRPEKGGKTMNYWKPEVSILGAATKLIELIGPGKKSVPYEGWNSGLENNPAYDLDE